MDILNEHYQDAGDFWGLRQQYRKQNLERLRRVEGIGAPELVDGRWVYRDGEGNVHTMATGKVKGPEREIADAFWGGEVEIDPLQVADGIPIEREIEDLRRDAEGLLLSETVSHGEKSHPAPDFVIENPADEDAVDKALQEYISRHE